MRYYVTTDKDGYVLSIRHTNSRLDFAELDLTKYDLEGLRLHAHKLGRKELIFDEDKYLELLNKETIIENKKEVVELKRKLTETDYIVARAFEEVMALKNPLTWIADVLVITLKYSKKYAQTISDRTKWRERIEEIENRKD